MTRKNTADKNAFGERLYEIVHRSDKTQAKFAEQVGIGVSAQRNYEKGVRSPDAEYLMRLYAAGYDVMYLLTGERSSQRLTAEESRILSLWHQAPTVVQQIVLNILQDDYSRHGNK